MLLVPFLLLMKSYKLNVSNKLPQKHGFLRKISQMFQRVCLNNPSSFALGMIAVTLIKLFVQIFDIITDAMIGNIFLVRISFSSVELVLFGGKIL